MDYQCSLTSATEFAKRGKLEEWVHAYLLSDGHNKEFSDGLKLYDRIFIGPIKMPLSLFTRCCGPEENMKWRIHKEWFEMHVNELEKVIISNVDLPPLIVHFLVDDDHIDGVFELNDGNHRHEAYSRLGIKEYPVIIWITEPEEYDLFQAKYSKYVL